MIREQCTKMSKCIDSVYSTGRHQRKIEKLFPSYMSMCRTDHTPCAYLTRLRYIICSTRHSLHNSCCMRFGHCK